MVKGGYQIINLDGVVHTLGLGMVHEGIYERIEGTQKPIMVSGINIGGFDYHDCYVEPKVNGSNYEFEMYGHKVSISDVDVVTITKSQLFVDLTDFDYEDGLPVVTISDTDADYIRHGISNLPFGVKYKMGGVVVYTLFTSAEVENNIAYGLSTPSAISEYTQIISLSIDGNTVAFSRIG